MGAIRQALKARGEAKQEHVAKIRDFARASSKAAAVAVLDGVIADPEKAEELAFVLERNLESFKADTRVSDARLRWAVSYLRENLSNAVVGSGPTAHPVPSVPSKVMRIGDTQVVQLGPGGFMFFAGRDRLIFDRVVMVSGADPEAAREIHPACGVDSEKGLAPIPCGLGDVINLPGSTVLWDSATAEVEP